MRRVKSFVGMHDTDPLAEARHFHRCFVSRADPPPELLRNFAGACEALGIGPDRLTRELCSAGADLVSAEFANRRRKGAGNPLTQRALVMLALAEARPESSDRFLLREPSAAGAWFELVSAPVRAAAQVVKGAILLWRHER